MAEFPTGPIQISARHRPMMVHLEIDASRPHRFLGRGPNPYVRGDGGGPCWVCGCSWSFPIHYEPLEGWPE